MLFLLIFIFTCILNLHIYLQCLLHHGQIAANAKNKQVLKRLNSIVALIIITPIACYRCTHLLHASYARINSQLVSRRISDIYELTRNPECTNCFDSHASLVQTLHREINTRSSIHKFLLSKQYIATSAGTTFTPGLLPNITPNISSSLCTSLMRINRLSASKVQIELFSLLAPQFFHANLKCVRHFIKLKIHRKCIQLYFSYFWIIKNQRGRS